MKKLFALLLAIAMMLTLTACGDKDDDKGVANKPEDVAEAYIKADILGDRETLASLVVGDMKKYVEENLSDDFSDIEDECHEYGIEVSINSVSDFYRAYKQLYNAMLEEVYGTDYELKIRITSVEDIPSSVIDDIKEPYLNYDMKEYVDSDKIANIKEGKLVTVEYTIQGELDTEIDEVELYIVKYGGKWKVADY